jgi:hypothetical protein
LVCPRAGLDLLEKRETSCLLQGFEPWIIHPATSSLLDYANPVLGQGKTNVI